MNFEEVQELLNKCTRNELRDHAFGDVEIGWTLDGAEVAVGYFGGGVNLVIVDYVGFEDLLNFDGDLANELRKCGTLGQVERNDETGPDEYQEGVTMPGLTQEGVLNEITTRPED